MAKIKSDDVSALSSAIQGKIKLVKADSTQLSGAVTTSGTDVVVTFENVTSGDYTLVIDKSVNGRDTDYQLALSVVKPIVTEAKVEVSGNTVKAVATTASAIQNACLILAVYNAEGRFVGAKLSSTITNQAMETQTLPYLTGYTAKAILVDGIATLRPIR